MCVCVCVCVPVWAEYIERWWLVAEVVDLHHWVGDGVPGHHLLILGDAALKGLPHVNVLEGDCRRA